MGKFKVKSKDSNGDKLINRIARIFKRKPNIVSLNQDDLEDKCIIIGNHNGAGGPFTYRTFLKKRFMSWGAHPMCEKYTSRWRYLYHVFYRQKLKYSKVRAFLMATFFGIISKTVYNHAGIIPVYYDMRIKQTYKYSFQCLEKNVSVFVFPENSNDGYQEIIDEFHPGFLSLSQLYYKKYNQDLPIYTMYYRKKPKTILIGKPMYYQELKKQFTEEEILEMFRKYMNQLGAISYFRKPSKNNDEKERIDL